MGQPVARRWRLRSTPPASARPSTSATIAITVIEPAEDDRDSPVTVLTGWGAAAVPPGLAAPPGEAAPGADVAGAAGELDDGLDGLDGPGVGLDGCCPVGGGEATGL